MPVIECDASETRAIDCELWVDLISQRALEDRARELEAVRLGTFPEMRQRFYGRARLRKSSTLRFIASCRVLPDGSRCVLPERFHFFRERAECEACDARGCEVCGGCGWTDLATIAWGDSIADLGGGRVELRPYDPLPRYADADERARLELYTASAPARPHELG